MTKVKRGNCLACNGTGKAPNGDFLYLLAYKHNIQKYREDIPESVRELVTPLIQKIILALKGLPGSMELAARRGVSKEEVKKSWDAMKKNIKGESR